MTMQEQVNSETTAVVPTGTTALTPANEFDYGPDAGTGYENQDMSDRKLPIIQLLQSNSPIVSRSKGKVWAGQFLNTVTQEVMDEVFFVPAITDHCYTEWVPRDDGGGFRGRHRKDSKVVTEAIAKNRGRWIGKIPVPQAEPPDHELVETFEIYGAQLSSTGELLGIIMIPFVSKKIAVYRTWNSQIANFAPTLGGKKFMPGQIPIFAHRVRMTSADAPPGGQYEFKVPVLSPAEGDDLKRSLLPPNDPRYLAAKKLHDDVLKGLARAAYETSQQDASEDRGEGAVEF